MRVLLDTNVLVRATGQASSPARAVFLRLLDPPHAVIVSSFLFDELRRVLNYPRVQRVHGLTAENGDRHMLLRRLRKMSQSPRIVSAASGRARR